MKSPVAVLERCPVCALPGHAGETDDLGSRPECVPSDECVEAYWRALTDEQRCKLIALCCHSCGSCGKLESCRCWDAPS